MINRLVKKGTQWSLSKSCGTGPQTSLCEWWINIFMQTRESVKVEMKQGWKKMEIMHKLWLVMSITASLFHYWSGNEGWGRVGQFPPNSQWMPLKVTNCRVNCVRVTAIWREWATLFGAKIHKGSSLQSTLSPFGSSEGWLSLLWEESKTVPGEYSRYALWQKSGPEIKLIFPQFSVSKSAAWQEKMYLFLKVPAPGINCSSFSVWYGWSRGASPLKNY